MIFRQPYGSRPRSQRKSASRRLFLEPLEERALLHAGHGDDGHGRGHIIWKGDSVQVMVGEWIAKFDGVSGAPQAQVRALNDLLKDSSVSIKAARHLGQDGVVLLQTPPDLNYQRLVAELDDLPGFRLAEPNFADIQVLATPNDPSFNLLYGLHNSGQTGGSTDSDIDAPEAWDIATGNGNVVVGVIDTGVDYNHPDLEANIWTNSWEAGGEPGVDDDGNGYIDDIHGYDFVNGDGDPYDDHYHGTHVSGTIGAVGNNGIGVAGVNWNAKIMGIKFLDSGGYGSTDGAIAAVNYATRMRNLWVETGGAKGADIRLTNNSWGGGEYSEILHAAINDSGAAGLLFVAAAGNYTSDNDWYAFYPANYDSANLISVAATDHNDQLAWFSNWGPTTVDLAAPGDSTYSTMPGNSYDYLSGTSMATPHVAGAAALAWSLSPNSTYQQIRDCLFSSVDLIPSLDGITATGGRLNVYQTLACVGMAVSGSSPADGETVSSPPTEFLIDFSHPFNPSTYDASDLTVNGQEATAVAEVDLNTLRFTFDTSPVTAQGVQTMHMAAGAVSATPGSLIDPFLKEWNASFHYDALPMEVVATDPPVASGVQLPLTTLTVTLNEAVDPLFVQASDLQLSQGSATAATVSADGLTITFELAGPTREETLTASIAPGALVDPFGNPNLPFTGEYYLDIGTQAFPTPLFAIAPKGSLIYDPSATAFIQPAGDEDSFTLAVDAGQTISVLVVPDSGLRPSVTLKNPGGSVVGSQTASAAGQEAVIQTVGPTEAGTYTIVVGGASGGAAGSFTVKVTLNAALEMESHDGLANNSQAAAQNIDGSFTALLKGATRGAIVGQSDAANPVTVVHEQNFEGGAGGYTVSNTTSLGWHVTTARGTDGGHSASHSFYYGKEAKGKGGGGSYVLKGKGKGGASIANAGSLLSPSILLPSGGGLTLNFNYWLQTQGSPALDLAQLQVRPEGSSTWTTLASYNSVAEHSFWAPAATVDLSTYSGQTVQLRWHFDTVNGDANNFEGWYVDDVRIVQSLAHDYYSFTATAGQHVSVALQALSFGNVNVQLLDADGATLASSAAGPTNVDQMIYDFGPLAAGTHYLAITGSANAPYSMVVTKDAVFDREGNDTRASAQPFGSNQVALGHIGSIGDILWVGPHSLEWNDGTYDITQISVEEFATQSFSGYDILYVDASAGRLDILQSRADDVAAFVSAGGGLITDDGGDFNIPDFSWTPHGNDLVWIADHQEEVILTAAGMTHPVTAGLTNEGLSFWGNSQHSYFVATAGLAELATNPWGDPNILAGSFGEGRVVYFGLDPSYHQPLGDTMQLIRQAVAWIGTPQPEVDYYSFTVDAGANIDLFTSTPADGGGEFNNLLDPTLRLFDADGLEVGIRSTFSDGRNERVVLNGAPAGTYYAQVSSEHGTTGEYVLDPITSPSPTNLAALADAPATNAASRSGPAATSRAVSLAAATKSPLRLRLPLESSGRKGTEVDDPPAKRESHAEAASIDAVFAHEPSWLKRSAVKRRR